MATIQKEETRCDIYHVVPKEVCHRIRVTVQELVRNEAGKYVSNAGGDLRCIDRDYSARAEKRLLDKVAEGTSPPKTRKATGGEAAGDA